MPKVIDSTLRLIDKFTPILKNVNGAVGGTRAAFASVSSDSKKFASDLSAQTSHLSEFSKTNSRIAKDMQKVGKDISSIGTSLPIAAITGVATAGYYLSQNLDKAIGKIRMLGNLTVEEAAKMRASIIKISNETGVSVTTIAEATQKAVAGGISAGDAMKYMSSSIQLSKISGMELNDVVNQTTTYVKAYNLSAADAGKVNDQLVVTARLAKTEISNIAPALASTAKAAADAGVSTGELNAAMAMMVAHGTDSQRAAGALTGLFDSFSKASPKAIKAAQQFGIELNQAHIRAIGFPAFLQEIATKTGGDEQAIGKIIKDVDAFKLAMKMTGAGGAEFATMLQQINGGSGAASSALEKMQTPAGKVAKAMNQLKNAGMELGAGLAPLVMDLADTVSSLVKSFNSLSDSQKQIIFTILRSIVVFGTITVVFGKFLTIFGSAFGIIGRVILAFTNANGIIAGLGTQFKALGLIFKASHVLLANPIILAVVAIIAAIYLLYTHWEQVKTFFSNIWQGIVIVFRMAVSAIGIVLSNMFPVLYAIISWIQGTFSAGWSAAWATVVGIFSGIFNSIAGICSSVMASIKAAINSVIGGINSISVDVPAWVPEFGGQHFGLSIPYLAKGTDNWQGGPAAINEKGAEIVDLPTGSKVIPHDKSLKQEYNRGQNSSSKNITFTIAKLADSIVVREDADIDKIAQALYRKLESQAINLNTGAVNL